MSLELLMQELGGTMSSPEVHYLYETGCEIKKYLEVGSFVGLSAISVGLGMLSTGNLENKEIWCVDTFMCENRDLHYHGQDTFGFFTMNVEKFGVSDLIKSVKGFSRDVHCQVPDDYFDVVMIDGDHSQEGVYEDYINYLPKLKQGGQMLFHDFRMSTGVTNMLESINQIHSIKSFAHTLGGFIK